MRITLHLCKMFRINKVGRDFSSSVTFSDLPVVAEASTQRDGDGGQVGHLVAVAVHPAVPPGAHRLWGQTRAARVLLRARPHGHTSLTGRDPNKDWLVLFACEFAGILCVCVYLCVCVCCVPPGTF